MDLEHINEQDKVPTLKKFTVEGSLVAQMVKNPLTM